MRSDRVCVNVSNGARSDKVELNSLVEKSNSEWVTLVALFSTKLTRSD